MLRPSILAVLSAVFYLSLPPSLWAEVAVGDLLEARQTVAVRESPPTQTLGVLVESPGKQVGNLQKGEKVRVVEVKTVKTLFNQDLWIKISSADARDNPLGGWVYYGTTSQSENFKNAR